MKPKPIVMKPEIPITRDSLTSKKMSLETPIGTLESDSGNHYIDVISIIEHDLISDIISLNN